MIVTKIDKQDIVGSPDGVHERGRWHLCYSTFRGVSHPRSAGCFMNEVNSYQGMAIRFINRFSGL